MTDQEREISRRAVLATGIVGVATSSGCTAIEDTVEDDSPAIPDGYGYGDRYRDGNENQLKDKERNDSVRRGVDDPTDNVRNDDSDETSGDPDGRQTVIDPPSDPSAQDGDSVSFPDAGGNYGDGYGKTTYGHPAD